MKSNDLRIGNYIISDDIVCKVIGIDLDSVWLKTDNRIFGCDYNDLTPISLSEEVLLKCGFIWMDHCKYSGWFVDIDGNQSLRIWRDSNKWFYSSNDYHTIEIKYLYQLQNLHFALTGKELEVNI